MANMVGMLYTKAGRARAVERRVTSRAHLIATSYRLALSSPQLLAKNTVPWELRKQYRMILYLVVAAGCCVVYDMLIHLVAETYYADRVHLEGIALMDEVDICFIRHFPYVVLLSMVRFFPGENGSSPLYSNQCRGLTIYQFVANEALIIAVEAVLIARVCAMFNCNRPVVGLVIALFAMEVAAMITILAFSIPQIQFNPTCLVTHAPSIFTSYWCVGRHFQVILISISQKGSSVLYILVRDGMWAYTLIFAIMLYNLLCYRFMDSPLVGLCFWSRQRRRSHVCLNLRRVSYRSDESEGTTLELLGSIEFAGRSMSVEDWMSETVIISTAGDDMT
ncbi:uncharacterized protein LAESUDRAFT_793399 [Laetiporus sulphureus 93-53]|uniref:Uncharacterized protein n=1 Tax=Laetiporus sulphureus 93-53 TaxID=1314785 RepID=A0A165GHA6_9APHY|nr:uncharacterized protein LAESUDRAFT_793399 [Laetiporus sulphureus 93-53]KZT10347.1 hypothetical protein LAESUDRAFT_793399 [Laetiporus sulphureus 93-53]